MAEFLSHLIEAPLANILILAGLFFLAIAVIGKISGKIEPDTIGRLMAGMLGTALLVYGISGHVKADKFASDAAKVIPSSNPPPPNKNPQTKSHKERPSPTSPAAPPVSGPLAGNWVNDNSQTRGITKLYVEQQDNELMVHAWGACQPKDCDWGAEKALASGNSASVTWDQGFVLRKMTISTDTTRLRMEMDSVYRDRRPPQHAHEFFVKGH